MRRVLTEKLPHPGQSIRLSPSEARHLIQVLRLRDSDKVETLDGKGTSVIATLRIHEGNVNLEFFAYSAKNLTEGLPSHLPITLELALLKGSAMEWAIEKAVELGVQTLLPLIAERSVVRIKARGADPFRQRWQKIADQALKQCGRLERMNVLPPKPLAEGLQSLPATSRAPRFWCDESQEQSPPFLGKVLTEIGSIEEARLLIGPEGGWSEDERQLLRSSGSATRVSLGPTILRAETAALYGVSLLNSFFRLLAGK